MDRAQVGLLLAIPPLVGLIAVPLLCNAADRLQRRELFAGGAYAAATTAFLAQGFAFPTLHILPKSLVFPFLVTMRVFLGAFRPCVIPLVNAIAISELTAEYGSKGHERFGDERLWGAVSWAFFALLLGFVLDIPNVGIPVIYLGSFLTSSCFLFLLWLFKRRKHNSEQVDAVGQPDESTRLLGVSDNTPVDDSENDFGATAVSNTFTESRSPAEIIWYVLTAQGVQSLLFFNLLFWLWIGMSAVNYLLFLYLEEDLHGSNMICGLSVVITVIFEIPLFAHAQLVLQKIGSPGMACIGAVCYIVRSFGYTIASNAWLILLMEPLHGVTYTAASMAGVVYVAERTPPELQATGQSLLAVIQAFGTVIGSALGGYVMENYGSKILYRSTCLLSLLATVAFAASAKLTGKDEVDLVSSSYSAHSRCAVDD